jgi:hypothetical protein
MAIAVFAVCAGCMRHSIDFSCDVPGKAIVLVADQEYVLPASITLGGNRSDLRFHLPTPEGGTVRAKAEIAFNDEYRPADVDRYAHLRAVFTRDLIATVEDGGAAIFTGYSASGQQVFRILFGKE